MQGKCDPCRPQAITAMNTVRKLWCDESGLTVASQDEVLVLVQVILDELATGFEDLPAAQVVAVGLHGELVAGDALWDVPHAPFTADPQGAVTRHCTHTHKKIDGERGCRDHTSN